MKNLNSRDLKAFVYDIEGHDYPRCILGSDRFLDWFPKKPPSHHLTTKYTLKMMRCAYELGIRGFDLSLKYNILDAFKQLREVYLDAIGIGNPNWLCGYKLDRIDLMEFKNRIVFRIFENHLNEDDRKKIATMPNKYRKKRLYIDRTCRPLSDEEVERIYIDEKEWLNRLSVLRPLSSFCLIGADYADWMCLLGRDDLINWQISSVRSYGMIPVSSSHWTSLSLPLLDKKDYAAHWVLANKAWMYLDFDKAISAIRMTEKPVTAFRILRGIKLPEDIPATIKWLRNIIGVNSVVVGVDNPEQANITIPVIVSIMCR